VLAHFTTVAVCKATQVDTRNFCAHLRPALAKSDNGLIRHPGIARQNVAKLRAKNGHDDDIFENVITANESLLKGHFTPRVGSTND